MFTGAQQTGPRRPGSGRSPSRGVDERSGGNRYRRARGDPFPASRSSPPPTRRGRSLSAVSRKETPQSDKSAQQRGRRNCSHGTRVVASEKIGRRPAGMNTVLRRAPVNHSPIDRLVAPKAASRTCSCAREPGAKDMIRPRRLAAVPDCLQGTQLRDQIDGPAAVTPLVVIPADHLGHPASEHLREVRGKK